MNDGETRKEQLYLIYKAKVAAYVGSRISQTEDAEDLVSQIFTKVYQNLPAYDESRASLSTWIYSITRNTVIDYYRTNHLCDEWTKELASEEDFIEKILKEELLEELAAALEKLDRRERDIILLHYYQEYTLKEIADKMCISYSYAKLLHGNALKNLRKYIKH